MDDRDPLPTARMTWSTEGAPLEPQRTSVRIGWSDAIHAIPIRLAADALLGQEALEPKYVELASRDAVPALVASGLDVAVVDLATFLGERVLGWDGVSIAMFGPVADDRSIGVVAVERSTWIGRRDLCERLWRASARALERTKTQLRADPELGIAGADRARIDGARIDLWWPTCRPSTEEIGAVAMWSDGVPSVEITSGLAWRLPM